MWKIFNIVILVTVVGLVSGSYLEFPLVRSPGESKWHQKEPLSCKNETALNQDADYREICFEKDISYSIPFLENDENIAMSVDLTAPISWIKSHECKIEGSSKSCHRIYETVAEKVKETKHKISKKLHGKSKEDLVENAIIQGSSEVIRGEIEKGQNVSFVAKDSSRLNNFFELIMLGLFIWGEHDLLQLENSNFINATQISPVLNDLSDGAISMRFDQTSQNSFLNQIFSYVKATEKTVGIYLGQNNSITIGDMTAKYVEVGFSDIQWVQMPEDEGFGLLPRLAYIGIEDRSEDNQQQTAQTLTAVLTMSASYIGLPESVINNTIKKDMDKQVNCTINEKTYYVECTASSKKKLDQVLHKTIFFGFDGKNINIALSQLVQQQNKKKIVLNIKKTFNNRVILGEPVFLQHYIVLDYSKNRFGFAPKRVNFDYFFVDVVTLVRFLCFIFVVGCCFIICFNPCKKMVTAIGGGARNRFKGKAQGKRLRQYEPLQENPYDELKGKIQEVIDKAQDEDVEGI